ncbi:P-loop containing nucleoside triphosphate hydrolase protein [Canariomyces notabilis]|uniref:P-loop containing nucleoside triphosphate hydrolase protein n=1 Tax=Canariomyces notabilis TaxID=2074819 RepID=A0AAN6TDI8_9PEZI|nr:P-loop containing nucleoside triphosphate hydrolase protein [Canariomyces arenarius]
MKPGHRNIIRSTASSHFDKKKGERESFVPAYQPDVIHGKGRGVVILLHGAPGVGKTATAEAVAQEFKKPLFPITRGDLGTTPVDVEKTLKDIFRYAHLWDCILLLDEADVFLTQRDRTDVERNALVSEYYNGILFLTTNRVGALDEAFRSRVHVSLYYPPLSLSDTLAILKDNLNRLPRVENLPEGEEAGPGHIQVQDEEIEGFITDEFSMRYEKYRRGPWNGRQICNAVQIASCLAFYEV